MKRPMLTSGIVITIICALLVQFPKSVAVILPVSASVLFLFLFPRFRKMLIVPVCCVCALITVLSAFLFYKTNIESCIPYHDTEASLEGKVVSTPVCSSESVSFILKTEKINSKSEQIEIAITLSAESADDIDLYDTLYIEKATLEIPVNEAGDYALTEVADGTLITAYTENYVGISVAEKTPYYYCLRLREIITDKINVSFPDETASLLNGMLFGDSNQMSYDTIQYFRNSGIAHLLAVSGLHTSLWCGILLSILKLLRVNDKLSSVICILFLCCFVIISAFTPSVIRASLMMSSVLIAPLLNRRADSLNSLGLAVTVILIINPYVVLSISFQLSAMATLGVIVSGTAQEKIYAFTKRIPIRQLSALANIILSSLAVSLCSALFTLPVSAYYFEVFSLLSPVANLFCVTLSFYGLMSGIVSTALSFIPITIVKTVATVISDVTRFIFDIITSIAKSISSVSFCTVRIFRDWLIAASFICAIILISGYLIHRFKTKSKIPLRISAAIVLITLCLCILTPIVSPKYNCTLTVVSSGNNINVIIRSGTSYAYLCSCIDSLPSEIYNYLPKATSETLKYYIPEYLSDTALYSAHKLSERLNPTETRLTDHTLTRFGQNDVPYPAHTIATIEGNYNLSSEISFEIIDTYSIKYAIINGSEKTVFVHLYGDTSLITDNLLSKCDVLVLNSSSAEYITDNITQVIISADTDILYDRNVAYNRAVTDELLITATDGTVQITI